MLEDEPTTSSDQSAADGTTGAPAEGAARPAKKAARKRATRAGGTAASATAASQPETPAEASPQTSADGAAAADGSDPVVAAEAPARPARKRAARKTTAKKTAKATADAAPPAAQDPTPPDAPVAEAPSSQDADDRPAEADAAAEPTEKAPARKRSRSRKRATAEATAPAGDATETDPAKTDPAKTDPAETDPARIDPSEVAAGIVAEVVAEVEAAHAPPDAAAEPDEDEDEETADEPTGLLAPLFQPPTASAPRRRRAASRPAGPPTSADDAPAAGTDTQDATGPRTDPRADTDTDTDTDSDPDTGRRDGRGGSDDEDDDQSGEGGGRRRRRRGGRGRRRRAGDDEETSSTGADAPSDSDDAAPAQDARDDGADESPADGSDGSDEAGDEVTDESRGESGRGRSRRRSRRGSSRGGGQASDQASAEDDQEGSDQDAATGSATGSGTGSGPEQDGADDAEEGGSRRRRRRRRRSGGGDDAPGEDDPPGTVTRVRQSRAGKDSSRDEVTGVRGSTRLEAKRQRRREGRESGRRKPIITESEFLARREAVARTMLVRDREGRTQIAVLEDGVLVEHFVARKASASMIGNVYVGKVQNVLPSMEAAFVDIGKGRNAVLYAGEVNWDAAGLEGQPRRIELALKSGDPVLVQVSKDPVGHKGARLTSQVSLPGRYLVYVPNSSMTGISRKLPDKERARLKKILKAVVPDHAGVIVRTAAEGASEVELERDVQRLQAQWEQIEKRSKAASPPNLLHGEPDLTVKVVRDVFNEDFSSLVVSGEEAWSTVKGYVDEVAPDLSERVTRWDDDGDVFAAHQVDEQIAKALERKVFLPSGGSLVIDRTEAMTVVDVNTGKFVGSGGNLEETVTRNNLEAAEEIVRQLRLRDVGGIIVIDFIDMVLESNRDLVLRRLTECLGRDRTKHQVAEVTSLGLVQMTRKRVGQGLLEAFSEPCQHCQGRGVMLFDEPVERKADQSSEGRSSGGGRGSGRGSGNGRGGNDAQPSDGLTDEARLEQQRRASAEAQKVHEAARKAMERAKEKEAAVADATVAVEEAAAQGEVAPAPEPEPIPEPEPVAVAEEPAAPAKRRRRRATSPATAPSPQAQSD